MYSVGVGTDVISLLCGDETGEEVLTSSQGQVLEKCVVVSGMRLDSASFCKGAAFCQGGSVVSKKHLSNTSVDMVSIDGLICFCFLFCFCRISEINNSPLVGA